MCNLKSVSDVGDVNKMLERMAELHLDLGNSLDMRIAEFKNDPEKMKIVNEFLHEIFEKAQKEAEKKRSKQKGKLDALGLQNGSKKLGVWSNRARASARTFASRIFTTICNCTNSVKTTLITRNNGNN